MILIQNISAMDRFYNRVFHDVIIQYKKLKQV